MVKINISVFVALLFVLCFCESNAQTNVSSWGNTYIQSNSAVSIHSDLTFNNDNSGVNPGVIMTNRSSQNPGVVVFGEDASWNGASDYQYIDGFVKTLSNEPFLFPVGDLGFFKPISTTEGANTMVAYNMVNPLKLANVNKVNRDPSSLENDIHVTTKEYWDVRGASQTSLTLYWDFNSDINALTDNINNLQIVGWNGNSWVIISSSVDENVMSIESSSKSFTGVTSSLTSGSITTSKKITPDDYEVITFGVITDKKQDLTDSEFISEFEDLEVIEFTLFPNPSSNIGDLNIDYDLSEVHSDATLVIFNSVGAKVFSYDLSNQKDIMKIPFDKSTSGLYHVGIITENGSQVFKPAIITAQ